MMLEKTLTDQKFILGVSALAFSYFVYRDWTEQNPTSGIEQAVWVIAAVAGIGLIIYTVNKNK